MEGMNLKPLRENPDMQELAYRTGEIAAILFRKEGLPQVEGLGAAITEVASGYPDVLRYHRDNEPAFLVGHNRGFNLNKSETVGQL